MGNEKITYLIGAGASARAVPIVKNLKNEISNHYATLHNGAFNWPSNEKHLIEKYSWDLLKLTNEIEKHASIDTFARKLYLRGEKENLKKLKALIDCFLTIHQLTNDLDTRYDAFLATIFSGDNSTNIQLPTNIDIVSWNYDFQLELALSNFYAANSIHEIENKVKFVPNQKMDFTSKSEFSVIKLNGTSSGLVEDNNFKRKDFFQVQRNEKFNDMDDIPDPFVIKSRIIRDVVKNYHATINDTIQISSILFAWEANELTQKIRTYATTKLRNTKILVVIGYSFPTFNRTIDKELLQSMIGCLSKIYVQAKSDDVNGIKFRISSLIPGFENIELIPEHDEFFIPFEFS